MNSTIKRLIGASGAAAVVAGAALMAAPAAQADGGYYGAWTLTAWKINSKEIKCPGKLPVPPPAPPIGCKSGEYLELKSNYEYKTNLSIFRDGKGDDGDFDVIKFPHSDASTIVFASHEAGNDPRAYQVKFQGKTSSGEPKKMVVFLTGVSGNTYKMIFRRDAD